MKSKFFYKIAIIHEKLLVLFNLLGGPDKTQSLVESGPRIFCGPAHL